MNEELYGVEIYDDTYESLYHAGKKGMKWGFNDGKRMVIVLPKPLNSSRT